MMKALQDVVVQCLHLGKIRYEVERCMIRSIATDLELLPAPALATLVHSFLD
jgi:hypothetical protein